MKTLAIPGHKLSASRTLCKECGLYYAPWDGFRGTCIDCITPDFKWDAEPGEFHQPIPAPPDPRIAELENHLNNANLAIYFLHGTLERLDGIRLPSIGEVRAALDAFDRQFPDYA